MAFSDFALALVQIVVFLWDLVTFPIYFLIYLPWRRRNNAKRDRARAIVKNSDEIVFRSLPRPSRIRDELIQEKVDTMDKVVQFCVKKYGYKNCLGTRTVIKEEMEKQSNGKEFLKLDLGEYKWKRYVDVNQEADDFGKGIRSLGVKPRDRVVIYADTKAEWLMSAYGLFRNAIAVVTVYTNLGDDGVVHGVSQTGADTVITSHELLPKLRKVLDKLPLVKTIVYLENPVKKPPSDISSLIKLISFTDVKAAGKASGIENVPPTPEDPAIIMYTSGSTGVPKGVVLTHANLVSAMCSILPVAENDIGDVGQDDAYIAFLPLAHVLELLAENVILLVGCKIGYSSPNTLTDKGTMIKRGQHGDAIKLRPTILAAVPVILDRIYKGIQDNVKARGPFFQKFANFCYQYRQTWVRRGYETPIMNRLVFAKMSAIVGGKVRLIMSGGAPLSAEAHDYIRTCLNVALIQGYGLTETAATACIMDGDDYSTGGVGPALVGVDIKLVNWSEGGYTVQDEVGPRGEIHVGGSNVAKGYFEMPEKTDEDFYDDENKKRWFRTGDIGQIKPDGTVMIIDRKKDLVKLQMGEYVSLGKVEANLKIHPLVDSICVYGDSGSTFVVALICPNVEKLREFAVRCGKGPEMPFEAMCTDAVVVAKCLESIQEHAKQMKLEKFETPKAITLVKEEWTPESGLITAAMKLKRKPIQEKYQKEIDAMYKKLNGGPTPRKKDEVVLKIDKNANRINKVGIEMK